MFTGHFTNNLVLWGKTAVVMDLEDLKRKFRLNISFRDLVLEHSVKSKFPRVIFKVFYLIPYHMDRFYDIEKNSIKSQKDLNYNTYINMIRVLVPLEHIISP